MPSDPTGSACRGGGGGLMCVTLRLPRRAVLLDEGSSDRRSDYLTRGDGNYVGLAEACDQRREP